jgi:hypothetical protein
MTGSGVIQGFFPRGFQQTAGFAAPVQAKCATPGCGQGRVVHSAAHGRSVQRLAASNAAAFQLPETMTKFTEIGGQPLPPNVRQKMDSFFGAKFADVRVHVGPQAAAIGALAFTQGSHIHFAPGQYNPASPQGQQVLGHELAHVVQQRAGRVRNPFGSGVAVVQDRRLESEADAMAARAAAHQRAGQHPRQMMAMPRASSGRKAVQAKTPRGAVIQRGWWGALTGAIGGSALGLITAGPAGMVGGFLGGAVLGHYGEELRNMPPNPHQGTLWNLPEDRWWRLFIDPGHHGAAALLPDPSLYYDTDQSPGYRRSMTEAYRAELLHSGGRIGRQIRTYAEYQRLHDLVTEGLPRGAQDRLNVNAHVRRPSGRGVGGFLTQFPIGGHGQPAADILTENIGGMRLLRVLPNGGDYATLGACICFFDEQTGLIVVNYAVAAGQQHVNAALARYHQEVGVAATRLATLEAIVRVIRALHVIHAFRDANGRLHIMLMLNRFLTEEGFSPVILRNNPEMFGGSYTITQLVQEVTDGMTDFRGEVRGTNGWFSQLA